MAQGIEKDEKINTISQETINPEMSDADLSYEMRNERRAADAQLYTLWKNRNREK